MIEPAAALERARNVGDAGIALRGRTAGAGCAYMEDLGVSPRVGRDV